MTTDIDDQWVYGLTVDIEDPLVRWEGCISM